MDKLNEQVKDSLKFLDSPYVSGALSLVIILYASLAAPKLPATALMVVNNPWVKLLVLFTIAYVAVKDPSMAIIIALAFTITLQTLNRQSLESQLGAYVQGVPYLGSKIWPQSAQDGSAVGMPMDGLQAGGLPVDMSYRMPPTDAEVKLIPNDDEGMYVGQPNFNGCSSFSDSTKMNHPLEGAIAGWDNTDNLYKL